MVEAMEPDQRDIRKEVVKHLKQIWEEFSALPDKPSADTSPVRELALILEGTNYTKSFRNFACNNAAEYKNPEQAFASMLIDLESDDLGILEPGVEAQIERNSLAQALSHASDTLHLNDGATIFSFPPIHQIHSGALAQLVTWADEFKEKQEDSSFALQVDRLRPYLPPPMKLN